MRVIGQIIKEKQKQQEKEEFVKRLDEEFPGNSVEEKELKKCLLKGYKEIKWQKIHNTDFCCGCGVGCELYKQVRFRFSDSFQMSYCNQLIIYAKNFPGDYHINISLYLIDEGRLHYRGDFLNNYFGVIDIGSPGEYFLEYQICQKNNTNIDLDKINIRSFVILSKR